MTIRDILGWFNLWIVVALAAALSFLSAITFLVSADVVAPADIGPEGWIRDTWIELDALTDADRAFAIGGSAGAFVFGLLVLIFEAIPLVVPPRLYGTDASGQTVLIDRGTIKQMIEKSAAQANEVVAAQASFRDSGTGLLVKCKATLVPEANITQVGRTLESKIKDDLRDLAGVSVSAVRLELGYATTEPKKEPSPEKEHPTTV